MNLRDPLVSLRCAHCNAKAVLGRESLTERLRDIVTYNNCHISYTLDIKLIDYQSR